MSTAARDVRVYFPGLNSLRFFAALFVLIGHVELTKGYLDMDCSCKFFERLNLGGIGVYFFFVLSGFLITYLLCVEKETYRSISLKQFYLRRLLRIWPLYYLLVILGFFILPQFEFFELFPYSFNKNYSINLLLYLLILPNLAFAFFPPVFPPVPHIGHLWSIGVEEQFYILWPILVRFSKKLFRNIIVLLVLYISFKAVLVFIPHFFTVGTSFLIVQKFFAMSKFECMIIGGLGALLLYKKHEFLLKIIYHPVSLAVSLLLFPVLSYLTGLDSFIQNTIHLPLSVFFLVIIMNVASNPKSFLKLEIKWLDYLGRISYGIYMYHMIVIFIFVKIAKPYLVSHPVAGNLVIYILSFAGTILVSHLSYAFFEKFFIKIKGKYSPVPSGK